MTPEQTYKSWNPQLEAVVRDAAMEAGFQLAGVAAADGVAAAEVLDGERFADWVSAGRAGEMEYLKRRDGNGALLRSGLRVAIPWARSVVVCALDYEMDFELPRSIDAAASGAGWIGRYAWSGKGREQEAENREQKPGNREQRQGDREQGEGNRESSGELVATDYHDELLWRLRAIESTLRENARCETRCYVDTGPIVERSFAARAGVGWVGKNTCVINQEVGSWLLLGVIVTSLPLQAATTAFAPDRCGSCTRCIDACPTNALVAPREMDASRCIAYLTIEKKGAIAEELREGMGRQVFGCDICQDVCPWNRRDGNRRKGNRRGGNPGAAASVVTGMEPRKELVNPSLEWLAKMDAKEFKRWFAGSPLERTGRKRLHRNVAIAMGNSGEARFVDQLGAWAEGGDEVLAEAAEWAIERIRRAEDC